MGAADDFEEDVETSADGIGRPLDASRQWQQSYFVREDDTGDDPFVSFAKSSSDTEMWVLETYQKQTSGETDPVTKLIGAPTTGCTVYTAEATVDGFKGTLVTVTSASIVDGDNYRDEPTYTP